MNKLQSNLHNYLFVALLFSATINAFVTYTIAFFILLLWIFSKKYKQKLYIISHDKLALSFLAIFILHLIGLLWSEDLHYGIKILLKQKTYLFGAILISFIDRKYAKYAIISLFSAIFISEIYSLYLYHISTPDGNGLLLSASPFMHHMHYSLVLAFAFGYLIYITNFQELKKPQNLALLLFAILTIITLFINKGRIGQIALVFVVLTLFIYKFRFGFFKSIIAAVTLFTIILSLAYHFSYQFQSRVAEAIYEYKEVIGHQKRDAISCRFEMWNYAKELGDSSPLLGIGTGDSITDMQKLLTKEGLKKLYFDCGLHMKYQFNPHNNFMLYYMQFGILGLLVILGVIYTWLRLAINLNSIPILILLIVTLTGMMSSSPISIHTKYIMFFVFTFVALYLKELDQRSS